MTPIWPWSRFASNDDQHFPLLEELKHGYKDGNKVEKYRKRNQSGKNFGSTSVCVY